MSKTVGQHYQVQVTAASFRAGHVTFSAIILASIIPKNLKHQGFLGTRDFGHLST